MNKILRMALVAAFGFMAVNSMMAQVERSGQPTTLDATWTEVKKPSATSDGDLHLAGSSTINFTVKNRRAGWTVVLEVRSASGTVKGRKYYRYKWQSSGLLSGSYKWQVSDDNNSWDDIPASAIHDNSTDGSIEVTNGETGDYLYMGLQGTFRGEVILTYLSSTTLRYDLYDNVPLFGTDTGTDNIQSNRIKDHDKAIDVYVHRNIAGNGAWSTLCLPFALSDFAVRKAFGEDIVYAEFDHVDLEKNQIHFVSVKNGGMQAGKPYLIQNKNAAVDNFFADDVTFTQNSVREINAHGRKSDKEDKGYYYVGLLQPTKANAGEDATFNPDNRAVYIANPDSEGKQKLKRLSPDGTLKAFRAYLCFPAADEDFTSSESKMMISLDDAITGIGNVLVDGKPVNNNIYNLNGQMVGTDDTVLPHGIYVRNGKKFAVK